MRCGGRTLGGDDAEEKRLEDVALRREGVPILVTAFESVQHEARVTGKENRRVRTEMLELRFTHVQ